MARESTHPNGRNPGRYAGSQSAGIRTSTDRRQGISRGCRSSHAFLPTEAALRFRARAMRSRTKVCRVPHKRRARCVGTVRSKSGSYDLFQRVRWPSLYSFTRDVPAYRIMPLSSGITNPGGVTPPRPFTPYATAANRQCSAFVRKRPLALIHLACVLDERLNREGKDSPVTQDRACSSLLHERARNKHSS